MGTPDGQAAIERVGFVTFVHVDERGKYYVAVSDGVREKPIMRINGISIEAAWHVIETHSEMGIPDGRWCADE